MSNPFNNIDLKAFVNQFPPEFIAEQNKKMFEETEKDYNDFIDNLKVGKCYLCGKDIEDTSGNPCLHWLINEKIKKKRLKNLLNSEIGFFRIYSYLVWCANADKPFVNINDLSCDIQPNRHYECTIKYKIWEWSISISKSDYSGHGNSSHGSKPHFHLQIIKNGQQFLNFGDCHILFTKSDLWNFAMIEQDLMTFDPGYGAGLEALQEDKIQEQIPEWLSQSSDDENAPFRTQTLIDTRNMDSKVFDEIIRLHNETKMVVPAIIEMLNREKGYNIKYMTQTIPNSFFEKQHRTQRGNSNTNKS